jgi:hypothetical protein
MNTIDSAFPTITEGTDTPAEKVKTSKALCATVMASPDYVPGSPLDLVLSDFSAETAALEGTNEGVIKADLAANVARNDQAASLLRWSMRKRALLTAVRLTCNGSAQKMKALGFGVLDPAQAALAEVPKGLRSRRNKAAGVAAVSWDVQPGTRMFMVQHATDPNDPTTYATAKSSSKVSFKLPGQTPGATISFRVYAIDPRLPAGQTDWSPWLAVKVSV